MTISGMAYAAPPARIISLAPNITELLYAIGLGKHVVAVTSFCDYPPEAAEKPKIGGFSNPSLEGVVAARPDMVIMTDDGNPRHVFEKLKKFGMNVYVFRAKRLEELPQGIREMGIALDTQRRAFQLAKKIERAIRSYQSRMHVTAGESMQKVLFVVQPEPLMVAGTGTVIDDAFRILGCQNIASDTAARYPKYSVEEVIRRAPDVIFIGKGRMNGRDAGHLVKRLSELEAVKKGRVYYTSESLYRLSPRAIEGIAEMATYLGRD